MEDLNTQGLSVKKQKNVLGNVPGTVSRVVKNTSTKVLTNLDLNPGHPLVKAIYDRLMKKPKKTLSKKNEKQFISLEFAIPSCYEMEDLCKKGTKKEFYLALNYAVALILSRLKIKPKWDTEEIDYEDDKVIKIWFDNSLSEPWVPKRKVRFLLKDNYRYLKIDWVEPEDEKDWEFIWTIDYRNEPQKNRWSLILREGTWWDTQKRFRFVNKGTKLFEIIRPSWWKKWVDVIGAEISWKKWNNYSLSKVWGIELREIPWINKVFAYSSKAWFISYTERISQAWLKELESISISPDLEVPKLDFYIWPWDEDDKENIVAQDKDSFLNINVWEDVEWDFHKFKWKLSVKWNIRANVDIDWDIKAGWIKWTPDKVVRVKSSWNISLSWLNSWFLSCSRVDIRDLSSSSDQLKALVVGNNEVYCNIAWIEKLSLKWKLTIDLWEELLNEKKLLSKQIKTTEKDIEMWENEFKRNVKIIETDLKNNFDSVSKVLSKKDLEELKKIFSAVRSLLYIEPFQIEKVMQFLNYIHNKHEFDFIWWYKLKFSNVSQVYNNVMTNKRKLKKRNDNMDELNKKIKNLAVFIEWAIEPGWLLIIQYGNKIIRKWNSIVNFKKTSEFWPEINPVWIYKRYDVEKDELIDITREEALAIFQNSV